MKQQRAQPPARPAAGRHREDEAVQRVASLREGAQALGGVLRRGTPRLRARRRGKHAAAGRGAGGRAHAATRVVQRRAGAAGAQRERHIWLHVDEQGARNMLARDRYVKKHAARVGRGAAASGPRGRLEAVTAEA